MNRHARRAAQVDEELIAEIIPPHEAAHMGNIQVIDLIDPFRLRDVPGKVWGQASKEIDKVIDQKAGRAAGIAEARVNAILDRAAKQAAKTAGTIALGTLAVGGLVAGVWYATNKKRGGSSR
jgi:hypothetical protein